MKKSIMAAQKCKNLLLQTPVKDIWSSANPKLKEISFSKLSLFGGLTEKNARIGGSKELLLFSSDLKCWSTVSFQRKA